VGEVLVTAAVKGTPFDDGTATLEVRGPAWLAAGRKRIASKTGIACNCKLA